MESIKNQLLKGAEGRPLLYDVHYLSDRQKKPVILYIHGFNGFKDWGNFDLVATAFAREGFFFVKMNLSHNGTTPDHPEEFADLQAYSFNNYSKEIFDTGIIINWLCEENNVYAHEFDRSKIILLGHSRGGGIGILKADQDRRVKALITWASVAYCKTPWGNWNAERIAQWQTDQIVYIENKRTHQQMPLHIQLYEDYCNNIHKLDIEKAVKSLSIPVQFCHGTLDEAVPYSNLALFQHWKPDAFFVTVESNHVFDRRHPYQESTLPEKCLAVIKENVRFLRQNGL